MKLLLINPKFPESFWSFKWAISTLLPGVRALNPPLGLATLAALCPPDWDVEIIDENIRMAPLHAEADIIGICGMGVQFERQKELLTYYRRQGYFTVAGGSYASLCPELYESSADAVVAGEAEYIWPEFCRDFEAGNTKSLYHETGVVSLDDSPVPRFDLLDLARYRTATMQFSRGCPFQCEFCDIIVMFGRKPRTKPLPQIEKELDSLRALGIHRMFFVDDNFIGNKKLAKDLLKFLIQYQKEHDYAFNFGTEASLNLAHDDELLQLFRDANFEWVFIGIESTDEESLKETKKVQNTHQDILASVRKIYAYGIDVIGGFIIGFDNDTVGTFDKQYDFIMESGIQSAMVGLLTAIPKTPLYNRLEKEHRLDLNLDTNDNSKLATNVIPKRMTYDEMINGYKELHARLFSDRSIAIRTTNKARYFARRAIRLDHSLREFAYFARRFLVHGLLKGGIRRLFWFFRSMPFHKPRFIPMAIGDWITGISTKEYIEHNFVTDLREDTRRAHLYVERMQELLRKRPNLQSPRVSFHELKNGAAGVSISLKGLLEHDSLRYVGRNLEFLLKNTRSKITLNIKDIHVSQLEGLKHLLKKLGRHGDRVDIFLDERSKRIISIDYSIFNMVLIQD